MHLTKLLTALLVPISVALVTHFVGSLFSPYTQSRALLSEHTSTFIPPAFSWDGLWFIKNATVGITHELSAAFYPGFSALIRVWTKLGLPLDFWPVLNLILLIICSILTHAIFRPIVGADRALRASMFILVSPAAPFLVAGYSETPALLTSLCAIYAAKRGQTAAALLAAACAARFRSNGLLVFAYPLLSLIQRAARKLLWHPQSPPKVHLTLLVIIGLAVLMVGAAAGLVVASQSTRGELLCDKDRSEPWCIYDRKHAIRDPYDENYREMTPFLERLVLFAQDLPRRVRLTLRLYSEVQKRGWDVKPFSFYKLTNTHMILLALPALFLLIRAILAVVSDVLTKRVRTNLAQSPAKSVRRIFRILRLGPVICFKRLLRGLLTPDTQAGFLLIFAGHNAILCLTCLTVAHMHIITRLAAAASPFLALVLADLPPKTAWFWCLGYSFAGAILFPAMGWLPWV